MIIFNKCKARRALQEARVDAVARMWKYQINEDGVRLSQLERHALIERHCELFGTWPN